MSIEEKAYRYCLHKTSETLQLYLDGKVSYEVFEEWCCRLNHQIKKLDLIYAIPLLGLAQA